MKYFMVTLKMEKDATKKPQRWRAKICHKLSNQRYLLGGENDPDMFQVLKRGLTFCSSDTSFAKLQLKKRNLDERSLWFFYKKNVHNSWFCLNTSRIHDFQYLHSGVFRTALWLIILNLVLKTSPLILVFKCTISS